MVCALCDEKQGLQTHTQNIKQTYTSGICHLSGVSGKSMFAFDTQNVFSDLLY